MRCTVCDGLSEGYDQTSQHCHGSGEEPAAPETVTLTREAALSLFWAGRSAGLLGYSVSDASDDSKEALARAVAASAEQIARGGG